MQALHAALWALGSMAALGIVLVAGRYYALVAIIHLTLRLMSRFARDAFWRVQRFSTDWHANNFAGSIVRRVTRGMWAVDMMDDTLLTGAAAGLLVLIGSSVLLGWHWPAMGAVVGDGGSAVCGAVGCAVAVLRGSRGTALERTGHAGGRGHGGCRDLQCCREVLRRREHVKTSGWRVVMGKWRRRTLRHLGTRHAKRQHAAACAAGAARKRDRLRGVAVVERPRHARRCHVRAYQLFRRSRIPARYWPACGQSAAQRERDGRDGGMYSQPLGVADRDGARPLRIGEGDVRFDHVTFRYGGQVEPLFRDFSLRIPAGERVGLVGHSGSGKTTFVKLLQRLYDVTDGRILIDGQNIANGTQVSLRAQIALVPQEPVLFHRSLAENIAYGRPGATMAEIERAADWRMRTSSSCASQKAMPRWSASAA